MLLNLRNLLVCACACLSLTAQAEAVTEQSLNLEAASATLDPLLRLTPQLALAREMPLEIQEDLPPLPTIDLTTQPDDLWQRVRNGFSMPNLDSPLVADRQAWYLNRPELLKHTLERSRRYLYYIVGELEKRGMPT